MLNPQLHRVALGQQGHPEVRPGIDAGRNVENEAAGEGPEHDRGLDCEKALPMQVRGPPPNGKYANFGSSSMNSGVQRSGRNASGASK